MKNEQIANKTYLVCFVVGAALTSLLLITIAKVPRTVQVILNICAVIGSGIMCSALVSYIVNRHEKAMRDRELCRQREIIFASFKSQIKQLIQNEVKNSSALVLLYEDKEHQKIHHKTDTVSAIIDRVNGHYAKIRSIIAQNDITSHTIKHNFLAVERKKHSPQHETSLWHYSRLNSSLLSLLSDSNLYLISGILDGEQIEILEGLRTSCECIIENSNEHTIDALLDYKSDLFKGLTDILRALDVDTDEELKYCEVEERENE